MSLDHTYSAADLVLLERAEELDHADELSPYRDQFQDAAGVIAYLDGNSLGRPLRDTPERLETFVGGEWGTRLIRSWDERWMQLPIKLGDRLGRVVLGAGGDQTYAHHYAPLAASPTPSGTLAVVALSADPVIAAGGRHVARYFLDVTQHRQPALSSSFQLTFSHADLLESGDPTVNNLRQF